MRDAASRLEAVWARTMVGLELDPCAFVDAMLAELGGVGRITGELSEEGGFTFSTGDESWQVHGPAAKGKVRSLCARLAVVFAEAAALPEPPLYGGRVSAFLALPGGSFEVELEMVNSLECVCFSLWRLIPGPRLYFRCNGGDYFRGTGCPFDAWTLEGIPEAISIFEALIAAGTTPSIEALRRGGVSSAVLARTLLIEFGSGSSAFQALSPHLYLHRGCELSADEVGEELR